MGREAEAVLQGKALKKLASEMILKSISPKFCSSLMKASKLFTENRYQIVMGKTRTRETLEPIDPGYPTTSKS